MIAILGTTRVGERAPDPGAWRAAIDACRSRTPASAWSTERSGATLAVRARRPSAAVGASDGVLAAIDGQVDNLELLLSDVGGGSRDDAPEALARLFRSHGTELFSRLSGRYAICVVDPARARVHLARDRIGAKPLYYARSGDGWCWASEPAALYPLLQELRFDPDGVQQAVHYRWLVGEQTLVAGVRQVVAGTSVTLDTTDRSVEWHRPTRFRDTPATESLQAWEERLHAALRASIASIPAHEGRLGVLLSGGVDSSLLAALALERGLDCVAITPNWPQHHNPEMERARRYARHLGIEHRVVDIDDAWIASRFPWIVERHQGLPKHYHAFGIAAAFEAVAGDVGMVLYGEGADTLFGGRDRVLKIEKKRLLLEKIPAPVRILAAAPLPRTTNSRAGRLKELLLYDMERVVLHAGKVDSGPLLRRAFPDLSFEATPSPELTERVEGDDAPMVLRRKTMVFMAFMSTALEMVDRLGTPHGVEAYAPFLSDPITDLGTSFPHEYRGDDTGSKPVIKAIAARYFPEAWVREPKLGFPTPINRWLGGPLASARARARDGHPALEGIFRSEVVDRLSLPRDYELIWAASCLTEFARLFMDADGAAPDPCARRPT